MIRAATPGDAALILRAARAAPAAGVNLEVNWRLLCENPAMPYRFYIADEAAVLMDFGRGATLCAEVLNEEEMLAFLKHLGKAFLTTSGWRPPGWRTRPLCVMELNSSGGDIPLRGYLPPMDLSPDMAEFFAIMENAEPIPGPIRDGMWFDLCARRNHGYFDLCGIRVVGRLVSAAAVFSLTEVEAYISGVETLPEFQHRGCASALVARLAAQYADRRVSLICEKELLPFYRRLGFAQSAAQYIDARSPGSEAEKEEESHA